MDKDYCKKISESIKVLYESGYVHPSKGILKNEDAKKTISESIKRLYENGYVNPMKGKKHTDEHIRKNREAQKKRYEDGFINYNSRTIIDTETGEIYNSLNDCERKTGYRKLSEKLRGIRKNNTPLQYV
jgi:hypothetical protein